MATIEDYHTIWHLIMIMIMYIAIVATATNNNPYNILHNQHIVQPATSNKSATSTRRHEPKPHNIILPKKPRNPQEIRHF